MAENQRTLRVLVDSTGAKKGAKEVVTEVNKIKKSGEDVLKTFKELKTALIALGSSNNTVKSLVTDLNKVTDSTVKQTKARKESNTETRAATTAAEKLARQIANMTDEMQKSNTGLRMAKSNLQDVVKQEYASIKAKEQSTKASLEQYKETYKLTSQTKALQKEIRNQVDAEKALTTEQKYQIDAANKLAKAEAQLKSAKDGTLKELLKTQKAYKAERDAILKSLDATQKKTDAEKHQMQMTEKLTQTQLKLDAVRNGSLKKIIETEQAYKKERQAIVDSVNAKTADQKAALASQKAHEKLENTLYAERGRLEALNSQMGKTSVKIQEQRRLTEELMRARERHRISMSSEYAELVKLRTLTEQRNKQLKASYAATKTATKGVNGLQSAFSSLTTAMASLTVYFSAGSLVRMSDEYKNLTNRLKAVSDSTVDVTTATEDLLALSLDSRTTLKGTMDLYTKMIRVNENLHRSQSDVRDMTEAVSKAVALSGASVQGAEGAIMQFAQAMSSNWKTSAQELNSILEQTPALAKYMAKGLREITGDTTITTASLKRFGEQGKLTSDLIAQGLLVVLPDIRKELEKTDQTISSISGNLRDQFINVLGQLDERLGGSDSVVAKLKELTIALPQLEEEVVALTLGLTALVTGAGLAAFWTLLGTAVGPILAVGLALGTLVGTMSLLYQEMNKYDTATDLVNKSNASMKEGLEGFKDSLIEMSSTSITSSIKSTEDTLKGLGNQVDSLRAKQKELRKEQLGNESGAAGMWGGGENTPPTAAWLELQELIDANNESIQIFKRRLNDLKQILPKAVDNEVTDKLYQFGKAVAALQDDVYSTSSANKTYMSDVEGIKKAYKEATEAALKLGNSTERENALMRANNTLYKGQAAALIKYGKSLTNIGDILDNIKAKDDPILAATLDYRSAMEDLNNAYREQVRYLNTQGSEGIISKKALQARLAELERVKEVVAGLYRDAREKGSIIPLTPLEDIKQQVTALQSGQEAYEDLLRTREAMSSLGIVKIVNDDEKSKVDALVSAMRQLETLQEQSAKYASDLDRFGEKDQVAELNKSLAEFERRSKEVGGNAYLASAIKNIKEELILVGQSKQHLDNVQDILSQAIRSEGANAGLQLLTSLRKEGKLTEDQYNALTKSVKDSQKELAINSADNLETMRNLVAAYEKGGSAVGDLTKKQEALNALGFGSLKILDSNQKVELEEYLALMEKLAVLVKKMELQKDLGNVFSSLGSGIGSGNFSGLTSSLSTMLANQAEKGITAGLTESLGAGAAGIIGGFGAGLAGSVVTGMLSRKQEISRSIRLVFSDGITQAFTDVNYSSFFGGSSSSTAFSTSDNELVNNSVRSAIESLDGLLSDLGKSVTDFSGEFEGADVGSAIVNMSDDYINAGLQSIDKFQEFGETAESALQRITKSLTITIDSIEALVGVQLDTSVEQFVNQQADIIDDQVTAARDWWLNYRNAIEDLTNNISKTADGNSWFYTGTATDLTFIDQAMDMLINNYNGQLDRLKEDISYIDQVQLPEYEGRIGEGFTVAYVDFAESLEKLVEGGDVAASLNSLNNVMYSQVETLTETITNARDDLEELGFDRNITTDGLFKQYQEALSGTVTPEILARFANASVLFEQITESVETLNDETISYQIRLANAQGNTDLALRLTREKELADATSDTAREYLKAIYAAEDAATAFANMASSLSTAQGILQGTTDSYFTELSNHVDTEIDKIDLGLTDSLSSLQESYQESLDANQTASDNLNLSIDALSDVISSVGAAAETLVSAFISENTRRETAKSILRGFLVTGDTTGVSDAAGIAASISDSGFSNAQDFAFEQATTLALLRQVEGSATEQLTFEEASLKSLDEINTTLESNYEDEVKRLNNQADDRKEALNELLSSYERQIDHLRNIDYGVGSLAEAIAQMTKVLAAEAEGTSSYTASEIKSTVDQIYANNVVGGVQDWNAAEYAIGVKAINSGVSSGELAAAMGISQEQVLSRATELGLPAFKNGGVTQGGWSIVGDGGNGSGTELMYSGAGAIYNKPQAKSLFDITPLIRELQQLRSEVGSLRAETKAVVRYTRETAKQLDDWDEEGLPQDRDY